MENTLGSGSISSNSCHGEDWIKAREPGRVCRKRWDNVSLLTSCSQLLRSSHIQISSLPCNIFMTNYWAWLNIVFIRLNAAACIKFLAFSMRRLFKAVSTPQPDLKEEHQPWDHKKWQNLYKKWRFTIRIGDMNTHTVTFTKSALFYCLSISENTECCLAVLWFYGREQREANYIFLLRNNRENTITNAMV